MSSTISSSKIKFSVFDFPKAFQLLLALSFLEAIGGGLSYHIAYFFSTNTTFNKLNIGLLGFGLGIGSLLGSIGGGYFTGKLKSKYLIGTSYLVIGLSFTVLAIANTFNISLIFVFFMGLGISIFITCSNTSILHISRNSNHSITVAQSYKNAFENGGCIIAMILIMLLAQDYFRQTMFMIGFLFVTSGLYIVFKFRMLECDEKLPIVNQEHFKTVYNALIPMLVSVFCVGLTYGIQKTVLGVHLNETIGSSLVIGFFFATDPILITIFQVKVSKSVDRFNKHVIACIGCVLLGSSTYAMSLSTTSLEMFCSLLFFTLGEMLYMAHSVALCHQCGSGNHSGLGIGAWRSSYALGMMIGPLFSGFAMYYMDSRCAWIIASLLCIVGALAIILSKTNHKVLTEIHPLKKEAS